ncbi:hypothetical protein OTU49_015484 [Cherax quadricarinatus]|uniref:Uncharacterized protein n=1 Tax=Cherax quadricarinatus TaxID=27406 RepID=A0AAW0XZ73_CHEQU
MERNKSQIILLDKNGLETVAKALSSGCWTLSESGNFEISGFFGTSNVRGNAPQLTLAQGNVRPVTQVSGSGGSANSSLPVTPERSPTFQHDNSQVTTLTELGKKLVAAAKVGNTNQVRRLMAIGAPFASDGLKMTALHWACDRGHTSIVKLLLKQHAQTDIANKFSKTPLHLAVENGHENIILLLQNGISCKEEEAVAVESISLDMTHDLDSLPVVCKTEEVHTEELLVEEICESSSRSKKGSQCCKEEEDIPSVDSELPHSIMADDADDQNISVLATLAELAQATSKGAENNTCQVQLP